MNKTKTDHEDSRREELNSLAAMLQALPAEERRAVCHAIAMYSELRKVHEEHEDVA